jgi:hypothetical protein
LSPRRACAGSSFGIVDREGCHVDFTGIGELWGAQTVASVRWALRDNGGVEFGRVTLKDGAKASDGLAAE